MMARAAAEQGAMVAAIGTGVGTAWAFWMAATISPPTAETPNWMKPRTADALPAMRPCGGHGEDGGVGEDEAHGGDDEPEGDVDAPEPAGAGAGVEEEGEAGGGVDGRAVRRSLRMSTRPARKPLTWDMPMMPQAMGPK